MRYLAAYLLAVLGGQTPDESTIKKILTAGDVNVDDEKLQKLLKDLEGKNIEEILEEGKKKLSSVPSGRPASTGATTGTTQTTSAPAEDTGAVSEEEDGGMGIDLFGDDF